MRPNDATEASPPPPAFKAPLRRWIRGIRRGIESSPERADPHGPRTGPTLTSVATTGLLLPKVRAQTSEAPGLASLEESTPKGSTPSPLGALQFLCTESDPHTPHGTTEGTEDTEGSEEPPPSQALLPLCALRALCGDNPIPVLPLQSPVLTKATARNFARLEGQSTRSPATKGVPGG